MVSDEVEGPNERFSKISGVLKLLGWRNGAEIEFCSVFKTTLCDQFCSLLPIGYKNKNGLPGWELDLKVWRARSGLYRRRRLQKKKNYSFESSWRDLKDIQNWNFAHPSKIKIVNLSMEYFFNNWRFLHKLLLSSIKLQKLKNNC